MKIKTAKGTWIELSSEEKLELLDALGLEAYKTAHLEGSYPRITTAFRIVLRVLGADLEPWPVKEENIVPRVVTISPDTAYICPNLIHSGDVAYKIIKRAFSLSYALEMPSD